MAIDQNLLEKIRNRMSGKVEWVEKKMFGGVCFMVDGKMCLGLTAKGLLARIDPEHSGELLRNPGTSRMMHGGKPMEGYLYVEPGVLGSETDLGFWIQKCLDYNPKARSSKK